MVIMSNKGFCDYDYEKGKINEINMVQRRLILLHMNAQKGICTLCRIMFI